MAINTPRLLFRGSAPTTSSTLYTTPTATIATLTDIVVANTDGNQQNVTIACDGVVLLPAVPVPANSVVNFQFRTVIDGSSASKIITGFGGNANVKLHLSGIETA